MAERSEMDRREYAGRRLQHADELVARVEAARKAAVMFVSSHGQPTQDSTKWGAMGRSIKERLELIETETRLLYDSLALEVSEGSPPEK